MPPVISYSNNLHTTVPFFVSWKRKESSTVHFPAICRTICCRTISWHNEQNNYVYIT